MTNVPTTTLSRSTSPLLTNSNANQTSLKGVTNKIKNSVKDNVSGNAVSKFNVGNDTQFIKASADAGMNLKSAESKLLSAIESGDEMAIQKAQILYNKALRVFAALNEMIKNAHEMMMSVIRNLRIG
jgi:hypothetical protein